MTEGIEAITTTVVGLALDAASLRQQAFAANIANADTVGYRPVTVNFEAQLEDARFALGNHGRIDPGSLAGLVPKLEYRREGSALGLAPKVMLDLEVAQMAENSLQYQALVKGLAKHFAILSAAASDGKK